MTAGGVVTTFDSVNVWVKATGGVKSAREYRFVETSPDGATNVVKDWSNDRACTWEPVASGSTLTAEVRDATMLTVEAAGVMRALSEKGQATLEQLNDLIAQLEAVDANQRSDEANAALSEAIAAAKAVASDGNATPAQLSDALSALQKAQATYQASPAVASTKVAGSWYKHGTYGTDAQTSSMMAGMVDGMVVVQGPRSDGSFALSITFTDAAAGMIKSVRHGGADAVANGATYRFSVSKDELSKPIPVEFNYSSPVGERTDTADLVLDMKPEPAKVDLSKAGASVTVAKATYTGLALKPAVAVTVGGKPLVEGVDFTVAYANNVMAGMGRVSVTGKGAYEGSVLKSFAITKAANAMKASAKKIKVKSSKAKNSKQKFKTAAAFKVKGAQGKVTFRKTSGNSKIAVSSNGTVTVKKGIAKGTYKVRVALSAAGDANYGAATKVVILTVRVK